MSVFALCPESIDWSATGSMLGGLASLATFFVALYASKTWKKGIDLHDRHQKIDALLESFILATRAGSDWQWHSKLKGLVVPMGQDERGEWPYKLASYRIAWSLSKHLLGPSHEDLCFSPRNLLREISQAGILLANGDLYGFDEKIESLLESGGAEILACRDTK